MRHYTQAAKAEAEATKKAAEAEAKAEAVWQCKLDPRLKAHLLSTFDCEKDIDITVLST